MGGVRGSPEVLTPKGWGDDWGPTYETEGWRGAPPSTGLVLVLVGSICDAGTSRCLGCKPSVDMQVLSWAAGKGLLLARVRCKITL